MRFKPQLILIESITFTFGRDNWLNVKSLAKGVLRLKCVLSKRAEQSIQQRYLLKYYLLSRCTLPLAYRIGIGVLLSKSRSSLPMFPSRVPVCHHLLTAVLVLLLPLPMLLSHQELLTSAWIHPAPLAEAKGYTCPGQGHWPSLWLTVSISVYQPMQ